MGSRCHSRGVVWGLWGGSCGTLACIAALAVLGRDGTMAGYGLLLLGVALPQWRLMLRR